MADQGRECADAGACEGNSAAAPGRPAAADADTSQPAGKSARCEAQEHGGHKGNVVGASASAADEPSSATAQELPSSGAGRGGAGAPATDAALPAAAAQQQPGSAEEAAGPTTAGGTAPIEVHASDAPAAASLPGGSATHTAEESADGDEGEDSAGGEPKDRPKLPRPEGKVPCPRCASDNTKFCYFNNYNIKQPRYFCRGCQRYWTVGGVLRDVPVGAGKRKSKAASTSVAKRKPAGVATRAAPPPPPPIPVQGPAAAAPVAIPPLLPLPFVDPGLGPFGAAFAPSLPQLLEPAAAVVAAASQLGSLAALAQAAPPAMDGQAGRQQHTAGGGAGRGSEGGASGGAQQARSCEDGGGSGAAAGGPDAPGRGLATQPQQQQQQGPSEVKPLPDGGGMGQLAGMGPPTWASLMAGSHAPAAAGLAPGPFGSPWPAYGGAPFGPVHGWAPQLGQGGLLNATLPGLIPAAAPPHSSMLAAAPAGGDGSRGPLDGLMGGLASQPAALPWVPPAAAVAPLAALAPWGPLPLGWGGAPPQGLPPALLPVPAGWPTMHPQPPDSAAAAAAAVVSAALMSMPPAAQVASQAGALQQALAAPAPLPGLTSAALGQASSALSALGGVLLGSRLGHIT